EFLRDDAACVKDRAGRNAAKDAFLLGKTMSAGGGFFIGYGHNPVEDSSIQHLGNETGADTLNLVHPRLSTGQNRRIGRLDNKQFHLFDLLLEYLAGTCSRAARSDPDNE